MINVKHLYLGMKVWDTVYGECTIRDITDTNNEVTSYFVVDVEDCDLDTSLSVDVYGKIFEIEDKYESFEVATSTKKRSVYFSEPTIAGAETPPKPPFVPAFKKDEVIVAMLVANEVLFRVVVIEDTEDAMIARPVESVKSQRCVYEKSAYDFFRITK